MKYLKMFGLAVIAGGVLMAFAGAGTASATELTCTEPAGTKVMCPNPVHIHAVNEGALTFDPVIGSIDCEESTITGRVSTGSSTTTPEGAIETLTFGKCNTTMTVERAGSLSIHTRTASADSNGTVTWTGAQIKTVFNGITCTITTGTGTDIGTLTGSSTTKSTATLDIEATLPLDGAFCGGSASWTGKYLVTTPGWLDID